MEHFKYYSKHLDGASPGSDSDEPEPTQSRDSERCQQSAPKMPWLEQVQFRDQTSQHGSESIDERMTGNGDEHVRNQIKSVDTE